MFVPLSPVDGTTKDKVWTNDSPNSSWWTRPLAIIAEKESSDLIHFVNSEFEPQEKVLEEERISPSRHGKTYAFQIQILDSMKDLKIRLTESKFRGSDCMMCYTRQEDWHNREKLHNPDYFRITRTVSDTMKLHKSLVGDGGTIKRQLYDYEQCAGFTSQPISQWATT
ncbi:unnamed protein product [Didymodactylos carnosus]|uniref:Uncharacterized protein n=1 Tax=Didymodactylos carnosus TaxID=1234261 RepID=A0A815HWI6_9BILA|nr:unnamed protein product [Didymodactylos carnosus]CAF4231973.1 unnamed protein product [Didymodactylos carnosus]